MHYQILRFRVQDLGALLPIEIIKVRDYKDTHRNKPENYFFGAARYQGCLVNSSC
jgi:hypothetical protein